MQRKNSAISDPPSKAGDFGINCPMLQFITFNVQIGKDFWNFDKKMWRRRSSYKFDEFHAP